MALRVVPVPCLEDNYAYLLIGESGRAVVIDPTEARPVRHALEREGATLVGLWLTHHHHDHVGGVEALVETSPGIPVIGSRYDLDHGRIPKQGRGVVDGETLDFEGRAVRVLSVPGHTLGAVAYLVDGELFTGDTLFLGGCGRVFEGTMPMMAASLGKLRRLAPETRVWCGHEYTVSNLRFAKHVDPDNARVAEAFAEAERAKAEGRRTIPGTLARELEVNPFLRFDAPELAKGLPPDASFASLREAKNRF